MSQAHFHMDEWATRVEGIRVEVDTRVNQLGVKVTQVYSKLGRLYNEIKVARNTVQENDDEILRPKTGVCRTNKGGNAERKRSSGKVN
jgi:hypothetical protein